MLARSLLVLAPALAHAAAPVEEGRTADREAVQAAVDKLDEAFSKGDSAARVEAIQSAATVTDAKVAEKIAHGFKDKDDTVVQAAVEALRWMDHPKALDELERFVKRDKKRAKESPENFASLLRAMAQHGEESSIDLLTDDIWSVRDFKVLQARILGLGHIRSEESVEALIHLMNQAGRQKVGDYMQQFRISLMALTGADQGESIDLWMRWWNDNKKDLEVPAERAPMPERFEKPWRQYWGEVAKQERGDRRRQRGTGGDGGDAGGGRGR